MPYFMIRDIYIVFERVLYTKKSYSENGCYSEIVVPEGWGFDSVGVYLPVLKPYLDLPLCEAECMGNLDATPETRIFILQKI